MALKKNLYSKKTEPLRYRSSNFDALIQHQIQALDFCYFWAKPKVKALRRPAEEGLKRWFSVELKAEDKNAGILRASG